MKRHRDVLEDSRPDRLPIDVLPYSNEEFVPPAPTAEQRAIMALAAAWCDDAARRRGVSRRRFLQTSAAYAVCLAAMNRVTGGGWAFADDCGLTIPIGRDGAPSDMPLTYGGPQLENPAG